MDVPQDQLLLKRPINIRAVVTPRWKEEAQQQLQAQINQADAQLQQLELQGQQMINEIQKQGLQIISSQATQPTDNAQAQIQEIQAQVSARKNEILGQKNQVLQQLNQVQTLNLDQEVDQGQIDSFFQVKQGDNLIKKMQVEVLLRDGVVEEIRGEL